MPCLLVLKSWPVRCTISGCAPSSACGRGECPDPGCPPRPGHRIRACAQRIQRRLCGIRALDPDRGTAGLSDHPGARHYPCRGRRGAPVARPGRRGGDQRLHRGGIRTHAHPSGAGSGTPAGPDGQGAHQGGAGQCSFRARRVCPGRGGQARPRLRADVQRSGRAGGGRRWRHRRRTAASAPEESGRGRRGAGPGLDGAAPHRPVVVVGLGARDASLREPVQAVADSLQAPIVATPKAKVIVPGQSSLGRGGHRTHPNRPRFTNFWSRRTWWLLSGSMWSSWSCRGSSTVSWCGLRRWPNNDPPLPAAVELVGDVAGCLDALAEGVEPAQGWGDTHFHAFRKDRTVSAPKTTAEGRVSPQAVMRSLRRQCGIAMRS